MHIDSVLSSNIQFADWVAACVTRGIDYQLVRTSRHRWIVGVDLLKDLSGAFTYESKLHLYKRPVDDIVHSRLLAAIAHCIHNRWVSMLVRASIRMLPGKCEE